MVLSSQPKSSELKKGYLQQVRSRRKLLISAIVFGILWGHISDELNELFKLVVIETACISWPRTY